MDWKTNLIFFVCDNSKLEFVDITKYFGFLCIITKAICDIHAKSGGIIKRRDLKIEI